ncbi:NAD-dependent epimerase/dehydratase family protein [Rhodobacterales bacterium HKCCSP123]|nr:NAD-dependent epimerase/dehydratase family protein [Rhodobacterales bacterium HKCCSP123]
MKVLVTGSEGYIGTCLVPMLRAEGHEVTRLDANLFAACALGPVEGAADVLQRDIRDLGPVDLEGTHAVIHLAGLSNDPLSDLDLRLTREINHAATARLGRIARQAGVSQFVFSSTCSVYGFQGETLITEAGTPNPLTIYAQSKLDAERDLDALAGPGFHVTHLRHGTAYGASPMTRFDLVVNNLVAWSLATGRVHLKSTGNAWRPLVHVEDIGAAFLAALRPDPSQAHRRVFNIAVTQDNLRIIDLAALVAEELAAPLEFADGAGPDHRSYRVDGGAALAGLAGFAPAWTVREGIRQVIAQARTFRVDLAAAEGPRHGRIAHLGQLLAAGHLDPDLRWREVAPA